MNKEYWKSIFLYEFSLISLVVVSILYKNNFYLANKQTRQELNNTNSFQEIAITDDHYLPQLESDKNNVSLLIPEKKEEVKEEIKKETVQMASADIHEDDEVETPAPITTPAPVVSQSPSIVSGFYRDTNVKDIEEKFKSSIKKSYYINITSYNSEAAQTDGSPCITASNMNVCTRNTEDIVATNDLPLHSKILIPEYFGERVFYVEDRMNARYTGTGRVDIWMKSKDNSKKWGVRNTKIIVLK